MAGEYRASFGVGCIANGYYGVIYPSLTVKAENIARLVVAYINAYFLHYPDDVRV